MVFIDQVSGRQSQHIEQRVKDCVVEQVGPAEYRVSFPDHEDKPDRRVTLGLLGDRGIAVCLDWITNAPCEANQNKRPCCHCVAAVREFASGIGKAA